MKKISSVSFWLVVFLALVSFEGVSTFAQSSEIIGKWQTGSVGAVQYQNQVTGQTRTGRSSLFSYKFLPNGSYEFIGLMEMNMYNCTSTYFNQVTGKYSVDGNTIHLNPARDYWKSTNSCAASGNKETTKAPTPKSIEFQTKTDEYGKELLCITDGTAESCYQRSKN